MALEQPNPGTESLRLFVAVQLSDEVRAALTAVQHELRSWSETVRWVKPPNFHLTPKFLGETPSERVPEIVEALTRVAASCPAFEMTLTECGCFPPRGEVRIVWVGVEDRTRRLVGLMRSLEQGLFELGFPRESRAFSPHLTIGRMREDPSTGKLRAAVTAVRPLQAIQSVTGIHLMSSNLSPHRPTYREIARAPLTAA